MKDLFGDETIRTFGLYQPFASLMLNGKVETRWVMNNKACPFPFGKYLLYSTKVGYTEEGFRYIAGEYYDEAKTVLTNEPTLALNGYALCIGDLWHKIKMTNYSMKNAYVGLKNMQSCLSMERNTIEFDGRSLWGLHFMNVKRIKPFPFKGKQGIGFLTKEQKQLIEFV